MQHGGEAGILDHWRRMVLARTNLRERGECALAQVFAERVNRAEFWRDVVEEIESPMIGELRAEARAETEVRARAATLLRLLRRRSWSLSASLVRTIEASTDTTQLDGWIDAVVDSNSLEQFRQNTGL